MEFTSTHLYANTNKHIPTQSLKAADAAVAAADAAAAAADANVVYLMSNYLWAGNACAALLFSGKCFMPYAIN